MDSDSLYRKARVMGGRTHGGNVSRRGLRLMMRLIETLALTGMFAIIAASTASSANVVGRVANESGEPETGVQVSALDSSGATAGSVMSDDEGWYEIHDLKPGPYTLVLKGQSVMSYVPKEGLTVYWGLSPEAPPLAIAKVGAAPVGAKAPMSK